MRYECAAGHCWLDEHVARLGEFDECFPGRIGFTDVDGLVERNGHALVIELKRPGAPLPTGQRIVLERMTTRMGDDFQAIVVWGSQDWSGPLEWQRWERGRPSLRQPVTLAEIKAHCRKWFRWADARPLPARVVTGTPT